MLELNKELLGDNIELLKKLPDNSVDAIITDPPAGVSFMGKTWDKDKGGRDAWIKWMEEIAAECLRVLKYGGHALVWSLPRTSHWTAFAWENAGFECRDKLAHIFGSGFPKNLDISKSIDSKLGIEREVIGYKENEKDFRSLGKNTKEQHGLDKLGVGVSCERKDIEITAPSSDKAKEFFGYGTGLKPSREDWWLFRKPIEKGLTITENVLKWGTGAINIEATKIKHAGKEDYIESVVKNQYADFNSNDGIKVPTKGIYGGDNRPPENYDATNGRYPSNTILSHSINCKFIGIEKEENQTDEEGIEIWKCSNGLEFFLSSFSNNTFSLNPLNDCEYQLGQIPSLIELIRYYNKTYKNLSPHVSEVYHNAYKQYHASLISPCDESRNVTELLKFLSFPADYLAYPHLCDILFHQILISAQESFQQLIYVLELVYHFLNLSLHNPNNQYPFLLSTWDDFLLYYKKQNISSNKIFSSEFQNHIEHNNELVSEYLISDIHNNKQMNKTFLYDKNEKLYHNASISDCVKLLCFLSVDLAYKLCLENSLQRHEIKIKTPICPIKIIDEQSGITKSGKVKESKDAYKSESNTNFLKGVSNASNQHGDSGGASRFFQKCNYTEEEINFIYTSKASTNERNFGLEDLNFEKQIGHNRFDRCKNCGGFILQNPNRPSACRCENPEREDNIIKGNFHPTVKSVSLMNYLLRIILVPSKDAIVLDPFGGSGTTGIACKMAGVNFILMDSDEEYVEIANARIAAWNPDDPNLKGKKKIFIKKADDEDENQLTLF